MAAALFAGDWVLAAEAFSGDEAAGTLLPSLILDSIPVSLVRSVTEEEQLQRQLLLLEKERQEHTANLEKLINERDTVIFTTSDVSSRRDKIADFEKKITDERTSIQENLEKCGSLETDSSAFSEKLEETVVLWKGSSDSLYTRKDAVEPADINALITGSVQIREGFLYVKAGLLIYPGEIACNEIVAAGTLSDAASVAEELASALVDTIVNATPVSLAFSIEPAVAAQKAEVTVDGMIVQNPGTFHAFQSGIHTITVEAPGYERQSFTYDFSETPRYRVDVVLPVQNAVQLDLNALSASGQPAEDAQVWITGKNAGKAPVSVTVNDRQILGVIQGNNGVQTFFTLDPAGKNMSASVLLREESSQSRIEKSRKNLYTSYGLLLLSLPFTFYFYGRLSDAYDAYTNGIPAVSTADEFYKWQKIERISFGVSIGCGVNMIYRIVRYMLDADSVLPEKADSDKEE